MKFAHFETVKVRPEGRGPLLRGLWEAVIDGKQGLRGSEDLEGRGQ